jgi:hypothetical protein
MSMAVKITLDQLKQAIKAEVDLSYISMLFDISQRPTSEMEVSLRMQKLLPYYRPIKVGWNPILLPDKERTL